jgi:hypothetical protein
MNICICLNQSAHAMQILEPEANVSDDEKKALWVLGRNARVKMTSYSLTLLSAGNHCSSSSHRFGV